LTQVEVVGEEEMRGGWTFRLRVGGRRHVLRLSWADYNLWSADGADPPHAVAAAVARFILSRIGASDLPPAIDASSARRRYPGADDEIPTLIRK
jgi:hypothetical protein